jgi:hypothetical protein
MSNYTIAVAWNGKDALSDSDTAKVISGDDFHTEFSAVQTAVNSKADLNGSATESFSATTAGSGTNTTQVATTAFVKTALALVYPIGAIFTTVTAYADSAAVVTAIGGTTWTAFGAGKVLIGVDSSDTDFDTVEETGGSKTSSGHTHTTVVPASGWSSADGSGAYHHTAARVNIQNSDLQRITSDRTLTSSSSSSSIVQPYITVYMWKRTA